MSEAHVSCKPRRIKRLTSRVVEALIKGEEEGVQRAGCLYSPLCYMCCLFLFGPSLYIIPFQCDRSLINFSSFNHHHLRLHGGTRCPLLISSPSSSSRILIKVCPLLSSRCNVLFFNMFYRIRIFRHQELNYEGPSNRRPTMYLV